MTAKDLCSIRMRASSAASHVSGAERLVPRDRIDRTVQELVSRAMERDRPPDQVTVTIDILGDTLVHSVPSLDLTNVAARDLDACRKMASGVSPSAIEAAFVALEQGASPEGGNMRGAMLVDAKTGERLDPDQSRGVRVSRFDWSDEASDLIDRALAALKLTHFRTKEALALATKVAHAPGVIAELCWSDEPDYTAGYVANRTGGYVRLPHMKRSGSLFGGRAFFVGSSGRDVDGLIKYLQGTPVLITAIGACRATDGPLLPGLTG
jgi:6-carboxyhexanoate--CoA ligase